MTNWHQLKIALRYSGAAAQTRTTQRMLPTPE